MVRFLKFGILLLLYVMVKCVGVVNLFIFFKLKVCGMFVVMLINFLFIVGW